MRVGGREGGMLMACSGWCWCWVVMEKVQGMSCAVLMRGCYGGRLSSVDEML